MTTENGISDSVENPEVEEQPDRYEGSSIRWKHFSTSFKLATKKASMGWSYEDFSQCIPNWSKANPEQADVLYQKLTQQLNGRILSEGEAILEKYKAPHGIDTLHQVVSEARNRKVSGIEPGNDVWNPDLKPSAAVRARIVPVLQTERDRLREIFANLKVENERLNTVLIDNKAKQIENDKLANQWLDGLESVATAFSALPEDQIAQWAIDAEETGS